MAEESLKDIIGENKKPVSKLKMVVIIVLALFISAGGAYYAINTLSNSVFILPGFQKEETTKSAETVLPTTPTLTPSPTPPSTENISEKDDTATIKQELDLTTLEDTSNSDSSSLEVEISKL